MQAARRSVRLDLVGIHEARDRDRLASRPSSADERQHACALWPVAEDHAAHVWHGHGARPPSRAPSRAPASRGCGGRRTRTSGSRRSRLCWLERSRILALEDSGLAAQAAFDEAPGVQPRKAERPLRDAQAERLYGVADPAADSPEVLDPVVARPDLVPVDHEPEAAAGAASRRPPAARSTGTRRCGRRRSGARGAAGARARRARTRAEAGCVAGRRPRRAPCAGPRRPRQRPAPRRARRRSHWRSVR